MTSSSLNHILCYNITYKLLKCKVFHRFHILYFYALADCIPTALPGCPAGFDLLFNGCFPLVMGRIPGVNRSPAMAGIWLLLFHGITFWVCNPARKVVQYDCRVDCIHFCGQADLWKRSRCANTGGVFYLDRLIIIFKTIIPVFQTPWLPGFGRRPSGPYCRCWWWRSCAGGTPWRPVC